MGIPRRHPWEAADIVWGDKVPRPKDFISLKWIDENGKMQMYKLREAFSPYWKDLGKVFGFHLSLLVSFEKHRGNHCEECLDDVLSEWHSNGSVPPRSYPVTWRGLIGALRDLGRMSREVDKLRFALSNRVEEEGAGGEDERTRPISISDCLLKLLARHGVTRITGHSYELRIPTLDYWQSRDVYSELGGFPLVEASGRGLVSAVRVLLVNGTDVNQRNQIGHTGLLLASSVGHCDVVATLLSAPGVLVDSADNEGATPLHVAAQEGHTAVAALLLQYHADVDLQEETGETALYKASFRGHTQVADLLLKAKASVDTAKNDGATPLHVAAQEGHTAVAALLLQYHADVDLQTKDGATAFYKAVEKGRTAVVELLLQYHADTDLQTEAGETALWQASFEGHTQVADLLLKAKASVDTPNNDGATPLFVAAQEGHTAVAALLLQYHADVNLQAKGGLTPLMIAAYKGHSEVVQELLTSKADLDHQDLLGRSALMEAVYNKRRDVAALLLSAGANPDLLEEEGGRTALMSAAQAGDLEAVQLLCVFGANPHIVDRVGATAAAIASAHQHTAVHSHLVEYMEQREAVGPTPPPTEQQPPPASTTVDENDVWDIIQLSHRVHSRMEAFDDEYLFQAYRDMFWRDDPEDYTPTYIAPPRHMTSRPVGSKHNHLSNIQDDDFYNLYNS